MPPQPRSLPPGGATPPTGLAATSLRRALHDLRGPLNTISILAEILRTGGPNPEACASMGRAVRGLGVMLDRVRAVGETVAERLQPVDLGAAVAAAIGRAPHVDDIAVKPFAPGAERVLVASCPTRLSLALDTLLQCAFGALAADGSVRFAIADDGDACTLSLAFTTGAAPSLPAGNVAGKLDTNPPGPVDWFRLACQIEGLAGELRVDGATVPPRIAIRLPKA